jgi:hypothetical protein
MVALEVRMPAANRLPTADPTDPSAPRSTLPSLADAAPWLAQFTPPFRFGSFFAPEDTVLCALATGVALRRARRPGDPAAGAPRRVVELTAGSALVLGAALLADPALRGFGAEVDPDAVERSHGNFEALGIADRARVRRVGLFSPRLVGWLRRVRPAVVACNPPYIPEPPDAPLALVAGAGPRGDRHPRRVLRAAAEAGAPRVVLSWCSLGDPVAVARTAARRGYRLERLWVGVLADGEYSGDVHAYMRTLPTSFLSEDPADARRARPGRRRALRLPAAGRQLRAERPRGRRRRRGPPACGAPGRAPRPRVPRRRAGGGRTRRGPPARPGSAVTSSTAGTSSACAPRRTGADARRRGHPTR